MLPLLDQGGNDITAVINNDVGRSRQFRGAGGRFIFAFEGKDWNFMIGNEAGGDVILGGKWVTGRESAPAALSAIASELFLLSRGSKPPANTV